MDEARKARQKKLKDAQLKIENEKRQFCWYFLQNCIHNLDKQDNCPLCKLVQRETREYYKQEAVMKARKIFGSNLEKAQMRCELLECWSRNQLSSYGTMKNGQLCAEVTLCARALTAVNWFSDHKEDTTISSLFRLTVKNLEMRKRIYFIGYYAVIAIQRFVRSYLCRQRVRAFMMKRFQFVHGTRSKAEHYIDTKTGYIWEQAPMLIRAERPTSPRTLQRRLNAIARKHTEREEKMKTVLKSEIDNPGSIWEGITEAIAEVRQLALLRDVLTCAFKTLTKRQSRRSADDFPVWLSLSHPSPSARMFGLALVLENEEPLEMMVIDHTQLVNKESGLSTVTVEKNGTATILTSTSSAALDTQDLMTSANNDTVPSDLAMLSINDRLQILEDFAWMTLVCETAEDVVDKLACGEIQPAMASAHQIAEDPHGIWLGDCNFTSLSAYVPGEDEDPKPDPPAKVSEKTLSQSLEEELLLGDLSDEDDKEVAVGKLVIVESVEQEDIAALSIDNQPIGSLLPNDGDDISLLQSPRVSTGRNRPWHHPVYPSMIFAPNKDLVPEVKAPELDTSQIIQSAGDQSAEQIAAAAEEALRLEEVEREKEAKRSLEQSYGYMKATTSKELVLPIQIQLRPYVEDRHPCGVFRLFFYDGVLVAGTQASPWAFYKEIYESRDLIVAAIINFSTSEVCRTALNTMHRRPNDENLSKKVNNANVNIALSQKSIVGISGRANQLPPISNSILKQNSDENSESSEKSKSARSQCVELFVPPEHWFYGDSELTLSPINEQTPLSLEECEQMQSKYRFLRRLAIWRNMFLKNQKARKKKKKPEVIIKTEEPEELQLDDDENDQEKRVSNDKSTRRLGATTETTAVLEITRQFGISSPYSSDLVGSEMFRLSHLEVPEFTRSHFANRGSLLQDLYDPKSPNYAGKKDVFYHDPKYPLLKYGNDTNLHTMISPLMYDQNFKFIISPKYRAEPSSGFYLTEMLRASCNPMLSMEKRIHSMRPSLPSPSLATQQSSPRLSMTDVDIKSKFSTACLAACTDLGVPPLQAQPNELNVVVMDVFIDIKKPVLKGGQASREPRRRDDEEDSADDKGEGNGDVDGTAETNEVTETPLDNATVAVDSASVVKPAVPPPISKGPLGALESVKKAVTNSIYGTRKEKNKEKIVKPKLNCSIHQIVGIFTSSLVRPPPSVDMSLMSWDIVKERGETPDSLEMLQKAEKQTLYSKKKERNEWGSSRSLPGVGFLNKRLPDGGNFHMRILRSALSRETIEAQVPKKFRKWLGLPY